MSEVNEAIAERLFKLAELLEIKDANPFKVSAYRSAAITIQQHPVPVTEMVENETDLTELQGVGDDIANKIEEIVSSGELDYLQDLEQEMPSDVVELLKIPGLGAKRVQQLQDELGIESVADLRRAALRHQIQKLSGFGEKLEQKILDYSIKLIV